MQDILDTVSDIKKLRSWLLEHRDQAGYIIHNKIDHHKVHRFGIRITKKDSNIPEYVVYAEAIEIKEAGGFEDGRFLSDSDADLQILSIHKYKEILDCLSNIAYDVADKMRTIEEQHRLAAENKIKSMLILDSYGLGNIVRRSQERTDDKV